MKPLEKLEPAELMYEIRNYPPVNMIGWTLSWLQARGLDSTKLRVLSKKPDNARKIAIECYTAIMNAQKRLAAKTGMSNLTPEQRSERAKKAVQARIEKYSKEK